MKFIELKNSLKEDILNAYYIVGKDMYLRNSAQKMITKKCVTNFSDLNISIFTDENFDVDKVINACNSIPFGDTRRVVVLSDVQPDNKSIAKLSKYLDQSNSNTCLIIKDGIEFNGYKNIVQKCEKIDCDFLDEKTLKLLVMSDFKKNGITITENCAQKLIEYCNFDMSFIDLESKKLINYIGNGGVVTMANINDMVHKNLEYSVFELGDAVANKNSDKAILLVKTMLDNKESPQKLLGLLTNNFRRMFYISVSKESDAIIANMLGVKEYAVKMSRRLLTKFSPKKLKNILNLSEQLDFDIKNGKMIDENAIYFFVSNIILM